MGALRLALVIKGISILDTGVSHFTGRHTPTDAYGRHHFLRQPSRKGGSHQGYMKFNGSKRIEIQNVRGFQIKSRISWLTAWRRTRVQERPLAWMIQETHVSSQDEVDQLISAWARLWGQHEQHSGPPMSYWSIGEERTAGVAILLTPLAAALTTPWNTTEWSTRVIAVDLGDTRLVNIYAPNKPACRERFFTALQAWDWSQRPTILAGDFNCVQSPPLDRLGGTRKGRPESAALQGLIEAHLLEDACILSTPVDGEGDDPDPIDFFTYWGKDAASRIDRFYVPQSWSSMVQGVSVYEPRVSSDHQRVQLHYKDTGLPSQSRRQRRMVTYPIRCAQPSRVIKELLDALIDERLGHQATCATWDATARGCVTLIQRLRRRTNQRGKAVLRRIKAQSRAHLLTRQERLAVTSEEAREDHLVRMGDRLNRSIEQIRWNFKRVSVFERDQTVTSIRNINGAAFTRGMTTTDRFASEWQPILGSVHNSAPPQLLDAQFDDFVTIPESRHLSATDNGLLMREININEVIEAIDALNRHKAAGTDGLNNDFFKDTQSVLASAMVAIGNEILRGGHPPQSFLNGLIIPLRKQGDSEDAMDYRPIALLQTSYKIFAKVIATRVQRVLGKVIGDSQQGFVHGRQMQKTVLMMMAILNTGAAKPEVAAMHSEAILLLDFRKAYDTVARDFIFVALTRFGFSPEFVAMIRTIHNGTTAQFLVNGELSRTQEVRSGIRQGCPLAPLLFIIAAEVLALAINDDPTDPGITVPHGGGTRHKFSAFVDDATVFLHEARHISRVLQILEQYGRLSGLRVQPRKSKLLLLNLTVKCEEVCGIPVLCHGDTTRYLGYLIGTGELTDVNWAARIRTVQRRLATATQLTTSVELRVLILNVIMLPSVLFTAAVFDIPAWAEKQLRNLQKQFLWNCSTSTEDTRHKVNPALLHTPKPAGGVGLASIVIACKTQRLKHAILWLTQRKDIYYSAWQAWFFGWTSCTGPAIISPLDVRSPRRSHSRRHTGKKFLQLLQPWLVPSLPDLASRKQRYMEELASLSSTAISWSTSAEWIVQLSRPLSRCSRAMTVEEQTFWPTYCWADNPWILDRQGDPLTDAKYDRIRPCAIEELGLQRLGVHTYSIVIPSVGHRTHQQAKLRRWGIAILLSAPHLTVGASLLVQRPLCLRHPPALVRAYEWSLLAPGRVQGTVESPYPEQRIVIQLEQEQDGIHWCIAADNVEDQRTATDCQTLRRRVHTQGIVFYAHPHIHGLPWSVPDSVANTHVQRALKTQPYRLVKGSEFALTLPVSRLEEAARTSAWQAGALSQTPGFLWAHGAELTSYQVWVCYRVAVRQLNLYFTGRGLDSSCRKLHCCRGVKETLEHIFWACPCAQSCWQKLICHWTGECWELKQLLDFRFNCASRSAPTLSKVVEDRLRRDHPDEDMEYAKVWRRLWRLLSSICVTTLWIQRNRVVFKREAVTLAESVDEFWQTGMRQLRAVAKREFRRTETRIQGARMLLCHRQIARQPREPSPMVTSPVQPPDSNEAPALLTRLKIYQTSCNR